MTDCICGMPVEKHTHEMAKNCLFRLILLRAIKEMTGDFSAVPLARGFFIPLLRVRMPAGTLKGNKQ